MQVHTYNFIKYENYLIVLKLLILNMIYFTLFVANQLLLNIFTANKNPETEI